MRPVVSQGAGQSLLQVHAGRPAQLSADPAVVCIVVTDVDALALNRESAQLVCAAAIGCYQQICEFPQVDHFTAAEVECLAIGLCEYLTPKGGARAKAEELAREIARFPQVCARADRRSAIKSQGLSVRDALIQEWYNGREALIKDGVAGAGRFKDGLGRHGDFARIR